MAVLLDHERTATIGCREQGFKKGMVICGYDLAFTTCSDIAEISTKEAFAFVRRCMNYQEKRWRHDNQHFVYYMFSDLYQQGKITVDEWRKFEKNANIKLSHEDDGSIIGGSIGDEVFESLCDVALGLNLY